MKLNFTKAINDVKRLVVKHSPEILTGIGVASMLTSTVLAVQATPRAVRLMEEAKKEQGVDKLTPVDTIKTTWKCYIPAVVSGVGGAACVIGAQTLSTKRGAALAAAYKLSETALTEYREQVIETIGETKEKVVRDKVAEKQVEKHPVHESEVIHTGKGQTKCLDPLSSRYFYSDIEVIRRAAVTVNEGLIHGMCGEALINEFYDELNLPHTDLGDRMGWTTDRLVKLDLGYAGDDNGNPIVVVGHENPPIYLGYSFAKFAKYLMRNSTFRKIYISGGQKNGRNNEQHNHN